MAKKIFPIKHSLYLSFTLVIIIGLFVSAVLYTASRAISNYAISTYYVTEEKRLEREEKYLSDLQKYVDARALSSEDTDLIAKWAQENRYVYLLVYKDNQLFFSSDISGEDEDYPFMGEMGSYPDRDELISAAEENGFHEIQMADGTLFASVAEFTEYFYYDVANVLGVILSVLALAILIILYLSRIIKRIKRLESDVAIVTAGKMTHPISADGNDEISTLSKNVENMRNSILENLQKEREARDANNALITSLSHDIRTPLTVLLGYMDIMKNHNGTDEVMQEYIAASENTAMRLKQLSDDMFKYSLAFGDDIDLKLEEYSAKTLLQQMFAEHILLLTENGYRVDFKRGDSTDMEDAIICTDAPNLMRIFYNIFSNLTKYADKSSPITVSTRLASEILTIEFKNRIKPQAHEVESNGIGLKTCARLASLITEGFEYENNGTTFTTRISLKINSINKSSKETR